MLVTFTNSNNSFIIHSHQLLKDLARQRALFLFLSSYDDMYELGIPPNNQPFVVSSSDQKEQVKIYQYLS